MSWSRREFLGASAASLWGATPTPPGVKSAEARGGVAATQSDLPMAAAAKVYNAGGNAVDAAVAACLAASATDPSATDLGGYVLYGVVLEAKTGKVWAVDANTVAPAAATPTMFKVLPKKPGAKRINELEYDCSVEGDINLEGGLAMGVPAALAGFGTLQQRWGRLKWPEVVAPTQELLSDGFRIPETLAKAIPGRMVGIKQDPASLKQLVPDGKPLQAGAIWHRPDMQWTLRRIADQGWQDFYKGEIASRIVKHVQDLGGILTRQDLASYEVLCTQAIETKCRKSRLYSPPLPNGGLTTLSGVLMLEELRAPDADDPFFWHLLAEILKLIWRDRMRYFGDPRFCKLNWERFVSREYIRERTAKLRRDPRSVDLENGGPPQLSPGTIHFTTADAAGNVVSLTTSHGGAFGSCVTVPGTGITLGHGMCRFDPKPGLANSIAPGKRPLANVAPLILRQHSRDVAFGLPGGRRIPSVMISLAWQLMAGKTGSETMGTPRMHCIGYEPMEVVDWMPEKLQTELKKMGHRLQTVDHIGSCIDIAERARDGRLKIVSNIAVAAVD